jgi:group I intron endonuclease
MTIGIYCLNFKGTNQVYIGQSTNIKERYWRHLYQLENSTHSCRMQQAYLNYGKPTLTILLECSKEELDDNEEEAISIFNSYTNGFNSRNKAAGGNTLKGPEHGSAKYTRDQIIDCMYLLAYSTNTAKEISKKLDIGQTVVEGISRGVGHLWLKEEYPEVYSTMLSYKNCRCTSKFLGIKLPSIKSPEGILYNLDNISKFAKEHNLNRGNLHQLLKGKIKSTKGWVLTEGFL